MGLSRLVFKQYEAPRPMPYAPMQPVPSGGLSNDPLAITKNSKAVLGKAIYTACALICFKSSNRDQNAYGSASVRALVVVEMKK